MTTRQDDMLHRVAKGSFSDWQHIPDAKRTKLQRLAAKTIGIVTPGNAVSILGLFLVLLGFALFVPTEGDKLTGILLVFLGRMMDFFDGAVASLTHTKSFVGATLDETLDMVVLAAALLLLVGSGTLPILIALAVGIPKALNIVSSLSAKFRKKRMYPTGASKLGTAVIWISIGTFMMHHVMEGLAQFRFDYLGWAIMLVALALTVPSTLYYMAIGLGNKTQE